MLHRSMHVSGRGVLGATFLGICLLLISIGRAQARPGGPPRSFLPETASVLPSVQSIDLRVLLPVDVEQLMAEDKARAETGEPGPLRFAVPLETAYQPLTDGTWQDLPDGSRVWRLRLISPGARSLNLGLEGVRLPAGASLYLYPVGSSEGGRDGREAQGPFTASDVQEGGELWTPIVPGDDAILELDVPAGAAFTPELTVARVNHDYVGFAALATADKAQGSCNIDVVCSQGDPWRNEIRSVAVFTLGGNWTCSGTLVNSHGDDRPPLFLTANHCSISSTNASTMVVYWNYESPTCGMLAGGSLADNQTGASLLAKSVASDFCLVRLNQTPDASYHVYYAGWDAREDNVPSWAVTIHHPNCDQKAISFTNRPLAATTYLQPTSPGDGTHWRISYWDEGTTEPGSSGSGLWDSNHRLVGQLHGGHAACDHASDSDWYGRLSRSWEGGGTSASRLRDWLDPASTGVLTLDGYDPAPTAVSGDANVDGVVSVLDLSAIVADILGTQALSAQGRTNADLDANGRISVVDLVRVVNLILHPGQPWAGDGLVDDGVAPLALEARLEQTPSSSELVLEGDLRAAAAVGLEIRAERRAGALENLPVRVDGEAGWSGAATLRADGTLRVVLYTLGGHAGASSPSRIHVVLPADAGRLEWEGAEAAGLDAKAIPVVASGFPLIATEEPVGSEALSVWPNPARQTWDLALRLTSVEAVRLELFDAAGRLLASTRRTDLHLGTNRVAWFTEESRPALNAGLYFVRAQQGARSLGEARLIVVR